MNGDGSSVLVWLPDDLERRASFEGLTCGRGGDRVEARSRTLGEDGGGSSQEGDSGVLHDEDEGVRK